MRPTILRAYCTGIRRCACSMKTTAAITTSPSRITDAKTQGPRAFSTPHRATGKVATTWVKIMMDMPLPMPCSVTSSPSHMITAVPAVIVITISTATLVVSS